MHMTKNLIKYIQENAISVEEVSKATGVKPYLLQREYRSLNAEEMLSVCQYLQIDPWRLFYDCE